MAKRFTDSMKWDDPFFLELPNKYKLLWFFMLDKCDHAGIYQFSKRLVDFNLNGSYTESEILEVFNSRITILQSGKWFLRKFISYQYGELNEANRAHNSVINILKKEGAYMGLISPIQGYKDKDKDKDKDIIVKRMSKKLQIDKIDLVNLKTEFKNVDVSAEFLKWKDWMDSKGKTYKNYNAAFRNWLRSDFVKPKEMMTNEKMHYTGSKLPN